MSSWGADISAYKASKGKVPWKPDQQKRVVQVTKYQKSREERQYDKIGWLKCLLFRLEVCVC